MDEFRTRKAEKAEEGLIKNHEVTDEEWKKQILEKATDPKLALIFMDATTLKTVLFSLAAAIESEIEWEKEDSEMMYKHLSNLANIFSEIFCKKFGDAAWDSCWDHFVKAKFETEERGEKNVETETGN